MKYKIKYMKNGKKYDFTITFKSLGHKITKLARYKKDSINFKATRLLDTTTAVKFIPYNSKHKAAKFNKHRTYINPQS